MGITAKKKVYPPIEPKVTDRRRLFMSKAQAIEANLKIKAAKDKIAEIKKQLEDEVEGEERHEEEVQKEEPKAVSLNPLVKRRKKEQEG